MKTCFRLLFSALALAAIFPSVNGQNGIIDFGFGDNGYVRQSLGFENNHFLSLLAQPDGKMLSIGRNSFGELKISRYLDDGSLDASFGQAGTTAPINSDDFPEYSVMGGLQPDGKIVFAMGGSTTYSTTDNELKIMRLLPDGKIDETFGNNGSVFHKGTGIFNLPSDRIHIFDNGDFILVGSSELDAHEVYVVKIKADGSLDQEFGQQGVLALACEAAISKIRTAIQAPNRLLIAASCPYNNTLVVHRIFDNGKVDPYFGMEGKLIVQLGEAGIAGGVAGLADGSMVVATSLGQQAGGQSFKVRKFTQTGETDFGFGKEGLAEISLNEGCLATGLALQLDGSLLIGGMSGMDEREDFVVVRLIGNGSLDLEFGAGGIAKTYDDKADHCANTMLALPDGKLLLAGFTTSGMASMARYNVGATGSTPLLKGNADITNLRIFTNPIVGNEVLVNFELTHATKTSFSLHDLSGRMLFEESKELLGGEQSEGLPVSKLNAGTYILSIRTANWAVVGKVVKL
ncbi:MAG: T9SS type A sorting domain-containing protein [Saprospiraceae bacterium]|nr:T9SS type A sorting domain-containing protein [Saprospiraceae bacterium]